MFIPENVVQKIFTDLDGDATKVLLYRIRNGIESMENQIEADLQMQGKAVREAVTCLKKLKIWEIQDLWDIKAQYKKAIRPLPCSLLEWMQQLEDQELNTLIEHASTKLETLLIEIEEQIEAPLAFREVCVVLYCCEALGLRYQIIVELFNRYGADKEYDSLIAQAEEWAMMNIYTLEGVKWYEEESEKYIETVRRSFQKEKAFTYGELRHIYSWGIVHKYPLELIAYACITTMDRVGYGAFAYASTILRNLEAREVYSLEDINYRDSANKPIYSRSGSSVQRTRRLLDDIFHSEKLSKMKVEH